MSTSLIEDFGKYFAAAEDTHDTTRVIQTFLYRINLLHGKSTHSTLKEIPVENAEKEFQTILQALKSSDTPYVFYHGGYHHT